LQGEGRNEFKDTDCRSVEQLAGQKYAVHTRVSNVNTAQSKWTSAASAIDPTDDGWSWSLVKNASRRPRASADARSHQAGETEKTRDGGSSSHHRQCLSKELMPTQDN